MWNQGIRATGERRTEFLFQPYQHSDLQVTSGYSANYASNSRIAGFTSAEVSLLLLSAVCGVSDPAIHFLQIQKSSLSAIQFPLPCLCAKRNLMPLLNGKRCHKYIPWGALLTSFIQMSFFIIILKFIIL